MEYRSTRQDEQTVREYYPRARLRRRISGPPPAPPAPAAGELVLERYRLQERLGAGGFGVVWRARDELLGREVAVKRIELGQESDAERADREAIASARLSHPAIVALYEACAVEGAYYLISELVDGDTLAKLISGAELDDHSVLEIGVALVGALLHAHDRGVVHRDIKPQNVLVPARPSGPDGAAKLADFGGASLAGEDALTRTGDVLGTLAYMAPEQVEGRGAGEEADLYSLALVLYEALSGLNPVRGPTPAATVRQIGRRVPTLSGRRRDLSPALTDAIDRSLEPDPLDRGTLHDLRAELEYALEEGPSRTRRRRRAAAEPSETLIAPRAARVQPLEHEPLDEEDHRRAPRVAVPRLAPVALALAACAWEVSAGRPGTALLLLAALAPVLAWPASRPSGRIGLAWVLAALAPALGLAGLAESYPAAAGQASRLRERACLGALGYWWLLLAEPLTSRTLWLGAAAGTPPREIWERSLSATAQHVIGPMLTPSVLAGALLWAAGAAALALIVRGRNAFLDLAAACGWSAALAVGVTRLDGPWPPAGDVSPRGLVLGAVVGAVLAVSARALRGPV